MEKETKYKIPDAVTEKDRDYYVKLKTLDTRVSTNFGTSLMRSIPAEPPLENRLGSRIKEGVRRDTHLRMSRSNPNLSKLEQSFDKLADLRKSRVMLNRHLLDRERGFANATAIRNDQNERFHNAVKNTGLTLDSLTKNV